MFLIGEIKESPLCLYDCKKSLDVRDKHNLVAVKYYV